MVDTSAAREKPGTTVRKRKLNGKLEGGMLYGQPPFSYSSPGDFNAVLKGQLRANIVGIPLVLDVDAGTALPARGRKNSVRLSIDAQALAQQTAWQEAIELDATRRELEKLRTQSMNLGRSSPTMPDLPTPGATAPSLHPDPSVDSASVEVPDTSMPSSTDSLSGAEPAIQDSVPIPNGPQIEAPVLDSTARTEQLQELNDQIKALEGTEQRLSAIVNARRAQPSGFRHLLSGVRTLEIGECSPTGPQFLSKDISLQGGRFEWLRNDIYLSLVHGRSFDDSWQTRDPSAARAEELQQAAVFGPTRDLNPRVLTAVVTGYGAPEKDHVHIGILRGHQYPAPVGAALPENAVEVNNLVLVGDAGVMLWKNHVLNLTYARSSYRSLGAMSGTHEADQTRDLLSTKDDGNTAMAVGWKTDIKASSTTLQLEYKVVGEDFRSLGVGFLRNDSRTAALALNQRISSKLKLRMRGSEEVRRDVWTATSLRLRRVQASLQYRPVSELGLTASAQPVEGITTDASGAQLMRCNLVLGLQSQWRKRIKDAQVSAVARVDRYAFRPGITPATVVWWSTLNATWQTKSGSTASLTWVGSPEGSSGGEVNSFSGAGTWQLSKRSTVSAACALDFAHVKDVNYNAVLKRALSDHAWCSVRVDRLRNAQQNFPETFGFEQDDVYNWTLSVGFDW